MMMKMMSKLFFSPPKLFLRMEDVVEELDIINFEEMIMKSDEETDDDDDNFFAEPKPSKKMKL